MEHINRSLMVPLSYISSPLLAEDIKVHYRRIVMEALSQLDDKFADFRKYAVPGNKFTIADCYIVSALDTVEANGIDMNSYPHVKDYYERISKSDKVSHAKTKMLTNPRRTRGDVGACC
jgi:glutathione S-transferase